MRQSLQRLFVAFLLTALSPVWADDKKPPLVMPPGYELPEVPDLRPNPASYPKQLVEQMVFVQPDRMVYRRPFDPTPEQWLGGLAEVVIGDTRPWAPHSRYQVYPLGLPGATAPDAWAVAVLGNEVVRFNGNFRHRPDAELQSLDNDKTIMRFDGLDLIVYHYDTGRRYRFSPVMSDTDLHWRLSATGLLQRPQRSAETVLHYDEKGVLEALELPNGLRLPVESTRGYVTRLYLPFGRSVAFSRDDSGRIQEMGVHEGGELGRSPGRRMEHLAFSYDDNHRLTRIQLPNRVSWEVDYGTAQVMRTRPPSTVWMSRVSCSSEKGVLFHVYTHTRQRREQNVTTIWGSTADGQSIEDAVEAYRFAEKTYGLSPFETSGSDYAHGKPWWISTRAALSPAHHQVRFTLRHHTHANVSEHPVEIDAYGRVTSQTLDGIAYTYTYTDSGDLLEATVDGQEHRFVSDEWGRIVRHEAPSGDYRQWEFNRQGVLSEIASGNIRRSRDYMGDEVETKREDGTTQLHYDRQGRLQRVDFADGRYWDIDYDNSNRVRTFRDSADGQWRYQYSLLNRLTRADKVDKGWRGYGYRLDGRLAREEHYPRGDRSTVKEYDPQARVVREVIQRLGETRYEYDDRGRQSRVIHPDGKDTIYTYDDLNRVIKIRGSHQPPLDISYDEQGRRSVSTPE